MKLMIVIVVAMCVSGCSGTRVVIVPESEPVQLAEDVKAYVYIETKDGQRLKSENRVVLHEGQWVATLSADQARKKASP